MLGGKWNLYFTLYSSNTNLNHQRRAYLRSGPVRHTVTCSLFLPGAGSPWRQAGHHHRAARAGRGVLHPVLPSSDSS